MEILKLNAVSQVPVDSIRIKIDQLDYPLADRFQFVVDGLFDVCVIRTDEGIVIDVYPFDKNLAEDFADPIATTYAFTDEVTPDDS